MNEASRYLEGALEGEIDFKAPNKSVEHQESLDDQAKVLAYLEQNGVMTKAGDHLVIDQDRLATILNESKNQRLGRFQVSRLKIIKALSGLTGYSSTDLETDEYENQELRPRPLLELPQSKTDLFDTFAERNRNAVVPIEQLVKPGSSFKGQSELELDDGNVVSLQELGLVVGLADYEVKYDVNLLLEENNRRFKILRNLERDGVLSRTDNYLIIDEEAIKNIQTKNKASTDYNKVNLVDALKNLSGYSKKDVTSEELKTGKLASRKVMALPASLQQLELNQSYPPDIKNSILRPWEIGRNAGWSEELELQSGEKANMAELAIAEKLHELGATRDSKTGELKILDPESGKYLKFNNQLFRRLAQLNPVITEATARPGIRTNRSFESEPGTFLKYLPHLLKHDVLRTSDITRRAGSESAERFNVNPRTISHDGYVSLSNSQDQFARYYLGRTKFLGEVPKENVMVRQLGPSFAGIFDLTHGGEKLMYTLDLATPDDFAKKQKNKMHLSQSARSAQTTFGKEFTDAHLHPYIAQESIPRHGNETEEQYQKRLTYLHDPEFVYNQCAELFAEAGIGIHNLPWSEQIVLAGAILELPQRDKIINFAKQFGLIGVRTLLSLDYDRNMGETVFALAEKLPPLDAQRIFQKYTSVVDTSYQAGEYLLNNTAQRDANDQKTILSIRDNLLHKAKDLLQTSHDRFATQSPASTAEISRQLDKYNEEALLFSSMFKALVNQGEQIESFTGLETEETTGPNLSKTDIEAMHDIYATNWTHKTTAEYWALLEQTFLESTKNPQARFKILRREGKVIAFGRFIDELDNSNQPYIHAGGFNSDIPYQRGKLAEVFFSKAVEQETEKGLPIRGETNPNNPMLKKYYEMGFVETGRTVTSGEPMVLLEIPPKYQQLKKAA